MRMEEETRIAIIFIVILFVLAVSSVVLESLLK